MGLTYQPPLAGLGARLLAVILDTLVAFAFMLPGFLFIAYGVLLDPSHPSIVAAAFGASLTFVLSMALLGVLFVMWAQGQTPGKRILGLRVIKLDTGKPASFWRMVLRDYIGKAISGAICYLGFIWALLDSNKRTWHDKIAGTIVVKER